MPLAACKKLEQISAGNTSIKTLPLLEELSKLRQLDIGYSLIPRKEVNAFREAHPRCKVEHSVRR